MVGRLMDGRYQVRSRIARGGMATVYLATDLRLERRVAIKVMHGHLADDSAFKERFIQEARSAARLAHPNVVNVFDQGQDSDMAYLVMEYLPGITLRDLLKEHGKLTTEQTLDVLEAVLAGLSAAHKAGIVHRDLKPENVLLADDGRIKIGDFGLARAVSANTASGAALLGTIAYLSPELVTRGVADARSDIYAVGIMMYEMLTGEQPYKGEQPMQIAYQHANDSVPPPSSKNSRVPAELDELVLWATAHNPEDRPRDARVMLDQLLATQALLATALPTGATAVQRTMVMPTARAASVSTDATVILRPAARIAPPVIVSDSTAELTTRATRRRARGWWLFVLVLVLAGLASGTGWYFGSGPGSHIAIPDVADHTVSDATRLLTRDGFVVDSVRGVSFSPVIAEGKVVATSPTVGAVLSKGGKVTLLISQGPEQLPVPVLVGLSEASAQSAITSARFTVSREAPIRQFDGHVAKGTVLDALDGAGNSLAAGTLYSDQRPIRLVVSAGPLPPVQGLSVDAAIAALKAVNLTGTPESTGVYSDTVDAGMVVAIDTAQVAGGVIRENDSVQFTVSKGPAPVVVPNVVGMTWSQAKPILTQAGFGLNYNAAIDLVPGVAKVQSVDPGAGKSVPKGTSLSLTFTVF
jgi:serine/threonine-protein kinase